MDTRSTHPCTIHRGCNYTTRYPKHILQTPYSISHSHTSDKRKHLCNKESHTFTPHRSVHPYVLHKYQIQWRTLLRMQLKQAGYDTEHGTAAAVRPRLLMAQCTRYSSRVSYGSRIKGPVHKKLYMFKQVSYINTIMSSSHIFTKQVQSYSFILSFII